MPLRSPLKTARFVLAALILATTLVLSSGGAAIADPIADAQAKANQVQAQVTALQNKAEMASEQYDLASSRYDSLSAQVRVSKRTVAKLDAQRSRLQGTLDTRAATLYREGPLNFLNTLLGARTFADFDAAYQILTNLNQRDADSVAKLKAAKEKAAAAQATLLAQQAQAAQQQRSMAANARQVKAEYAASKQVLAQANATVQQLIAQRRAAEAAAARAEAARVLAAQAEARRLGGRGCGRPERLRLRPLAPPLALGRQRSDDGDGRSRLEQGPQGGRVRRKQDRLSLRVGRVGAEGIRLQRAHDVGVSQGRHLSSALLASPDRLRPAREPIAVAAGRSRLLRQPHPPRRDVCGRRRLHRGPVFRGRRPHLATVEPR